MRLLERDDRLDQLTRLHDIAAGLGPIVSAALLADAGRLPLFAAVLKALAAAPRRVVFEDLHWADEATLDLLAYVGRRIDRTRTLLVASYRDDELGPAHPLRRVLGVLAGSGAARVALAPLSLDAVRQLADRAGIDAAAVHQRTGGNPFFVTELLAAGGGMPPTVRDAVLARAARLAPPARAALEAAAVVGPRIGPWLLEAATGADAATIDECLAAGVLRGAGEALEFRHELARQTVLEAMSAPRRQALHRSALQALRARPGVDLARLAEHAEAALDREAVLEFAPRAARQAAAVGAHREAQAQYARALRFADDLPAADRAALLEAYAGECPLVGELAAGVAAREQSIELRRQLGDVAKQAEGLTRLPSLLVSLGRNDEAEAATARALVLLEPLPPGCELANAYRAQSALRMLARDNDEAIRWGRRALELAERLGDRACAAAALNSIGSATLHIDYEAACALLERSRAIGLDAGDDQMIVHADSNLGSGSGEVHRFAHADGYLQRGIAQAIEREIDPSYMQSWRALCLLHLGRWSEAGEVAIAVLAPGQQSAIARNMAQLALGRLRARRGDAGTWSALDEALRLAEATGHLQRVAPVRAARAEAAWLGGQRERCLAEARAAFAMAAARRHAWFVGELAYWLAVAGEPVESPQDAATPYALQIAGDWRAAAEAWAALHCPYEQARALAAGDDEARRQALAIFDRLGARPAAESLRQRMRADGQRCVPRGPRASTRTNPFGLTVRELDILGQLAQEQGLLAQDRQVAPPR